MKFWQIQKLKDESYGITDYDINFDTILMTTSPLVDFEKLMKAFDQGKYVVRMVEEGEDITDKTIGAPLIFAVDAPIH